MLHVGNQDILLHTSVLTKYEQVYRKSLAHRDEPCVTPELFLTFNIRIEILEPKTPKKY